MACFSVFHAVQGKIESTRPLEIVKLVILDHHRGQNDGQNHYFSEMNLVQHTTAHTF